MPTLLGVTQDSGTNSHGLKAKVVGWADDHFPGFVHVEFVDGKGRTLSFVEKVVVVEDFDSRARDTDYPVDLVLPITVQSRETADGVELMLVELAWSMLDEPVYVRTDQVVSISRS